MPQFTPSASSGNATGVDSSYPVDAVYIDYADPIPEYINEDEVPAGIYESVGETNGRNDYQQDNPGNRIYWDGARWIIVDGGLDAYFNYDDVSEPYLITSDWVSCSKENGDVIVSMGEGASPDLAGVYKYRGEASGKPYYYGYLDGNIIGEIVWNSSQWKIEDGIGGFVQWSSTEDVATPDLVDTWTEVGGSGDIYVNIPDDLVVDIEDHPYIDTDYALETDGNGGSQWVQKVPLLFPAAVIIESSSDPTAITLSEADNGTSVIFTSAPSADWHTVTLPDSADGLVFSVTVVSAYAQQNISINATSGDFYIANGSSFSIQDSNTYGEASRQLSILLIGTSSGWFAISETDIRDDVGGRACWIPTPTPPP